MTQPPLNVPPVMPPPFAASPQAPTRKNWFRRNLAWVIPVGCLTLLVLAALFIGGIVFFVMGLIKSSTPFNEAMNAARANADLDAKRGDLVAFGRPFISNPDLVSKLQHNKALTPSDPSTFYTPGENGYTVL